LWTEAGGQAASLQRWWMYLRHRRQRRDERRGLQQAEYLHGTSPTTGRVRTLDSADPIEQTMKVKTPELSGRKDIRLTFARHAPLSGSPSYRRNIWGRKI
jgi:hypothetical protein